MPTNQHRPAMNARKTHPTHPALLPPQDLYPSRQPTFAHSCVSIDAARSARVVPDPCRPMAAQARGLPRQHVFGAEAPASKAPEDGRSKVVFSCHENSPSAVCVTPANNLALRGHPICRAPRNGRTAKRPPLPMVAADLGSKASATPVYDLTQRSLGRCGHNQSIDGRA